MRRSLCSELRKESGSGLLLVTILVALLGLLIVPSLRFMYAGARASRVYEISMADRYSADSGVEHVLGRLKYESGFADSINQSMPVLEYDIEANGRQVHVVTEYVDHDSGEPPEGGGPQSWGIEISKEANPSGGLPGQQLTITYTITVRNVGTSTIYLNEVGDRLPAGFQSVEYVAGSSSGIKPSDPQISWVDGRLQLVWPLGRTPGYRINAGTVHQQQFQVLATLGWDTHLNLAWVLASPSSIGYVSTGDTAPVEGARLYDVTATAGNATVKARVGLASDSSVAIISWNNT